MGARSSTRKPSEISWHRVKGRKVCIIRCPRNTSAPFNCCASTANEELGNRSKLVVCGTWTDLGPCLVSVVWIPILHFGRVSFRVISKSRSSMVQRIHMLDWVFGLPQQAHSNQNQQKQHWAPETIEHSKSLVLGNSTSRHHVGPWFSSQSSLHVKMCVVLVTCHVLSMLALFMLNPAIFITCLQWL